MRYEPISSEQVPPGAAWDVPRQNQGQIVEVAYSDGAPPRPGRAENNRGDLYQRVRDTSDGSVTYYRRAGE